MTATREENANDLAYQEAVKPYEAMIHRLVDLIDEAHESAIFSEDDDHDPEECGYCLECEAAAKLIGYDWQPWPLRTGHE